MKLKILLAGLVLFGISFTVQAQSGTPRVTKKQINQQKRIVHGVKSGELTKAEFVALEKQQKKVNKRKKAAKADGIITPAEKIALNLNQKSASANIYRKKHNNLDRY